MNLHPGLEAPRMFPTFRYRDAAAAIGWLQEAFGFKLHAKHMDRDIITHAQMNFGSSMIMLGSVRDDEYGAMVGKPQGTVGVQSIYIAVDDPDALHARAQEAGADILEAPTDRDYGSREFICRDPEGHVWAFGTYWPKAHEKEAT